MITLLRDLRYAFAQFERRPLLYGAVILSLALGIGANATIFSYTDAVLLRMPAVSHPETLAEVYTHNTDPNAAFGGLYPLSYLDYKDIRDRNHAFADVAIYDPLATVTMSQGQPGQGGTRVTWSLQLASGNYFSVLGVQPVLGRGFLPEEASTIGTSAVLVLAYHTWQQQFGGNPAILGQKVLLNQVPYTVIGVAPANFGGLMTGIVTDGWAPVTMAQSAGQAGWLGRGSRAMFGIGRLKPGVTIAQATADLTIVQQNLDKTYPDDDKPQFLGLAEPLGGEPAFFRGPVQGANMLLMVIVGLVLLIACFNAASLLLVEAHGRQREWAIRSALGASRGRLLRQGMSESLLLAAIAGVVGLELGRLLAPLLLRLKPEGFPVNLQFGLDPNVVIFAVLLTLATGVIFGLAPAWQASRTQANDGLKDSALGSGGSGRHRLRHLLIAAQVALCMLILVGAALCLRSLAHANAISPGFDTDHMLVAQIDPAGLGYSNAAASRNYLEHLVDQLQSAPGVRAVAVAAQMPLGFVNAQREWLAPGMMPPPGHQGVTLDMGVVGPGYFAATGTRLLQGRDFARSDLPAADSNTAPAPLVPNDPKFVVVNQALAQSFWPHQDAVGQEILMPDGKQMHRAKVIGVAENGKYRSLGEVTRRYVFVLAPESTGFLLVRTAAPAAAAESTLRAKLLQLDPNLTNANVTTAADNLKTLLFPVHATSLVLIGFGSLVLLLALVGLYGVIAGAVAQRTREFGVRIAIGAAPQQVLAEVLRQGLRLALWGIAAGALLSVLAGRAIATLLYGISPLDPLAYVVAAALLVVVALVSSYIPARRAANVDPQIALRCD
ncbi:MAG TPA: ABC transporter permease [Terriglobales bacterium]|nr:ABC transporter permease [Terriglobales bacterium]